MKEQPIDPEDFLKEIDEQQPIMPFVVVFFTFIVFLFVCIWLMIKYCN
jgi:lipopolysaccharide export LptBFGC system permease protein LptF